MEAQQDCDLVQRAVEIPAGVKMLSGFLNVPPGARGIVLFAHGSGSSRFSTRNQFVASQLHHCGVATLLFDLLADDESDSRDRVFDIELLSGRLEDVTIWQQEQLDLCDLRTGYFGASTGAAAALVAASRLHGTVAAVVSRGGRPDLAIEALPRVKAPTLLIVGGGDRDVLELNRKALTQLRCEKELAIVPGASHLFPEPGALQKVSDLAAAWFIRYLHGGHDDPDAPHRVCSSGIEDTSARVETG
jgi:pimeloyl-ACP methyl ester carboxylesterase